MMLHEQNLLSDTKLILVVNPSHRKISRWSSFDSGSFQKKKARPRRRAIGILQTSIRLKAEELLLGHPSFACKFERAPNVICQSELACVENMMRNAAWNLYPDFEMPRYRQFNMLERKELRSEQPAR